MKKIQFKITSWSEGEKFMEEIAKKLNVQIQPHDENLVISTDEIRINHFPDDRGFSFISCKVYEKDLLPLLKDLKNRYEFKE